MVGTTISHYEVLEKIGQGGMGEVYRAEDTNLSREVAIKVLPEQFTQDPQRLKQARPNRSLTSFLPDNTIGPKEEIPIHSVNKQPLEMVCAFAIAGIQEGHCG